MKTRSAAAEVPSTEAMDSLKIATLHPAYAAASPADRIAMANLGAACWGAVKDGLFVQWAEAMSAEEGAKADVWRKEGRVAALEEMGAKLSVVEGLTARLAAADATIAQLRGGIDAEVSVRVAQQMEVLRKDYELAGMKEAHALEKAMLVAEERVRHLPQYEERLSWQAEEIAKLREQIHAMELEKIQSNTKSSHVLGKEGEMTVFELLSSVVVPAFPYSSVKDVTTKSHAADFHLWIMTPQGKRVKILVDSKNYTRSVNMDEITKLYADVDADEEADCGMMVSLTSAISKVRQFEVKMTEKHKPVIFLTFQDLSTEQQHNILCWAVSALLAVTRGSQGERSYLVDNIDGFLMGLSSSLMEIDTIILAQARTIEGLRQVKANMLKKITEFRTEAGLDAAVEDEVLEGCVAVLKATGGRCGRPVHGGGTKCRNHMSRKDRIVLVEDT